MGAVYLSCVLNVDDPDAVASFGYEGIPSGQYPSPVAGNFLRCTTNNTTVAAKPFGQLALTQPDFTGDYVISGYSRVMAAAIVGSGFEPYTYDNQWISRFYLPSGISGEVKVFVKIESSAAVGIEHVGGGGAGTAYPYVTGGLKALLVTANASTGTAGDVTFTCHVVSNAPPPAFWTSFVGSQEIN